MTGLRGGSWRPRTPRAAQGGARAFSCRRQLASGYNCRRRWRRRQRLAQLQIHTRTHAPSSRLTWPTACALPPPWADAIADAAAWGRAGGVRTLLRLRRARQLRTAEAVACARARARSARGSDQSPKREGGWRQAAAEGRASLRSGAGQRRAHGNGGHLRVAARERLGDGLRLRLRVAAAVCGRGRLALCGGVLAQHARVGAARCGGSGGRRWEG